MSVSVSASFLKPLSADESPILAVRILPPATDERLRLPYHLALLIDGSGSMEGERINAVKRTLHLLIDAMVDGDSLSLIEYNTVATTLASATIVAADTRPVLHTAVDTLVASGGTNLESAIQCLGLLTSVDSVFLLTDGHVNQGISSANGLLRLVTAAVPVGTPVNTLGFGAEHNSRMLRDMSVRSRGSYTYADAAELLPAIIGDIMGGLASEYGRNTHLSFPDGWVCMEYGADKTAQTYSIGTLISEKPQWVVLKGAVGTMVPPELVVTWRVNGIAKSHAIVIDGTIPAIDITEQYLRAKVASTFAQITELLEMNRYDDAKIEIEALGKELDDSSAHSRPFVLRLRAQVDEMLESVVTLQAPPPPMLGGVPRNGLLRNGLIGPPLLAPVLSRLASNTATLGVQRGYLSQESSTTEDNNVFSTPRQLRVARAITGGYVHSEE
jgi:hypothetical protein